MKILYVEDNRPDAELVRLELEQLSSPFTMDVAMSLREAHDRLAKSMDYDLVLVDMNLPDGNGLDLLAEIREQAMPMAVVVLTGSGDEETAVSALKSGADDYVVKRHGFLEKLPLIMENALDRSRAEASRKARRLRVLYAEPSGDDIALTQRHLSRHAPHIWIESVQSAEELLPRLSFASSELGWPYDVLLLDYRLPGMSALDLIRTLRQERGLDIPAVLITGHGNEELATQSLRLGFNDYLVKSPGYLFKLPATLENAFQSVNLAREQIALRESEVRYRALVESSTDHLFMLTPDGRYLSSNDRIEQFGLMTGKELIDKTLEEVYPTVVLAVYQDGLEQIARTELPVQFEHRQAEPSGQTRDYEVTLYPIAREGHLWAVGGICRDVTEHRRLETQFRQIQKMDAVGRLAGGVAHDFNNMLTVIITYAQMALNSLEPLDPLYSDINEILKAGTRSAALTRQLLAFARQQTVEPKVLDLNQVLEHSKNMLHRLIGEDIELKWIPAEALWNVRIDPSQIDQILANLAVNARDAIGGVGSIVIETANVVLDENYCRDHLGAIPGDFARISFSDSGIGMDEETLAQIFEPFFTTKREGEGTGLGLSTIYGIVKQNNGSIYVYSEPGRGTTFNIHLPRFDAGIDKEVMVPDQQSTAGTETILVVEDEEQILRLCERVLQQQGYSVLTAKTPGEAIVLCEKHARDIHLIITDVVMPIMNGKELMERLETIRPGIKSIFMSGYTANVIALRGVLPEGIDFIQKPISPKQLAQKVRQVLDS